MEQKIKQALADDMELKLVEQFERRNPADRALERHYVQRVDAYTTLKRSAQAPRRTTRRKTT